MSQQSRDQIKNFIRTGQFTKRPTEAVRLSDIPEEKVIDGRPRSHHATDKHKSVSSTVSELSTTSTKIGSVPVDPIKARAATHSPQPGDMLFVPPDIRSPTTFGPNQEFTAVPSIVTYSSSGRGKTRVTVREATAEEAAEHPVTNPPPICAPTVQSNVPVLAPPPNFEPIRMPHNSPAPSDGSHKSSQATLSPRISHLTQGSDSIRTSTTSTSFRTSTASTHIDDSGVPEPADEKLTMPAVGSPSPRLASDLLKTPETKSWPLPAHSRKGSEGVASTRAGSTEYSRGSTPTKYPSSFPDTFDGTSQSRFSWHVSNSERASNWFTRWFIEWWMMEIFSWIFSFICMMIIAIVLWKYDGKQLPQWKLGVSINAFISIFSGFAKSALLLPTAEALGQLKWDWFKKGEKKMMDFEVMDSASRGPWGSMVMLARTKGVTLASVGAAIILLSLPLDLFFQQIVSYPAKALLDPSSNATISRSIFYDPAQGEYYSDGFWGDGQETEIEAVTIPFLYANGAVTPGVSFDCPTGNCTYDPFYTMAADFQCKQMPPTFLEFGCKNTSAEWMSSVIYKAPKLAPNVTSCGYYMNVPNNPPQLMAGYEINADGSIGEVLSTRMFALTDVITNERFFGGSINYKNLIHPIVDFVIASTPDRFDGAKANNTPIVHECEIHWVVKKLQSKVVSGTLIEEALETLQFESDLDDPWDPEDSGIYLANFSMSLDDVHAFTNDKKSLFGLTNQTALQVLQVWSIQAPSTENLPSQDNPITSVPIIKYAWIETHIQRLVVPQLLFDTPNNITEQVGRQVSGMNEVIRRNTNSRAGRQEVAVGKAFKYVVVVHIRWQWITLPAALLLFSLIFLVATVVRSSKEQDKVGIWKTSALAILFNGLGEDVQDHVGQGNHRMGYQRSRAKEMKVQLDDD